MSSSTLSLVQAAADVRDGRISSAELVADCLQAHRRGRCQGPGLDLSRSRPCHAAGRGGRRPPAPRPRDRSAAWRADRHQGHFRYGRHADRVRLAPLGRPHAEARRGGGGAAARGRCDHSRQDRDHRVCLFQSGQDPQSARSRAYARRFVERLGRRCRGLHGARRHRLADQWLGDPSGRVLRRGRLQADARAHSRSGALLLSRTLDHVGVFARSVEDAALLAEIMAGFDEEDPDTRADRPPAAGRGGCRASRRCRPVSPSSAPPSGSMPSPQPARRSPSWWNFWAKLQARSRSAKASGAPSTCIARSWRWTWPTISTAIMRRAPTS